MSTYHDLHSLIDQMTKAAIDSEFRCQNLLPAGDHWYLTNVEVEVYDDGRPQPVNYLSDGHWDDNLAGWYPNRALEFWPKAIPEMFVGWDSLPDPARLDGPVDDIRSVHHDLTVESSRDEGGKTITAANVELASALTTLTGTVGGFHGEAIQAFNRQIVGPLPTVISGQDEVAGVLAVLMLSERATWTRARDNLARVADAALHGFTEAHPGGSRGGAGEVPDWIQIVGALADMVNVIVPAAAVLDRTGKAISAMSTVSEKSPKGQPDPLGAATPHQVLEKLRTALEGLQHDIAVSEREIFEVSGNALRTVRGNVGAFDLKKPDLLNADDADDFLAANQIDVDAKALKDLATMEMSSIAGTLESAADRIHNVTGPELWDRPSGLGDNSWSGFSELAWEFDEIARNSAWAMQAAAEHLIIVADDFGQTDASVHADLAAHTAKVRDGSGYSAFPQPSGGPTGPGKAS